MGLLLDNKNGSASEGSAILIVVLVMSVLSICCMTFWQNSQLFYDVSLKRLAYEQKYRATSCGLDYAISLCSKNFDNLGSGPFEIETDEFKFSENMKYKCKIYITKNGSKGLDLKSVLLDMSGQKAFQMACRLQLSESVDSKDKGTKKFFIKNWKVCD